MISGVVSVYAKPTSIGPPKFATPAMRDRRAGAGCTEPVLGLASGRNLRSQLVHRATGEAGNQLHRANVGTVDEVVGSRDQVLPAGGLL